MITHSALGCMYIPFHLLNNQFHSFGFILPSIKHTFEFVDHISETIVISTLAAIGIIGIGVGVTVGLPFFDGSDPNQEDTTKGIRRFAIR